MRMPLEWLVREGGLGSWAGSGAFQLQLLLCAAHSPAELVTVRGEQREESRAASEERREEWGGAACSHSAAHSFAYHSAEKKRSGER